MVILAVLATLLVALAIATQLTDAGVDADRMMDYVAAREANYQVARSAVEMGMEVIRADDNDSDGPEDTWAVGQLDVEWEGKAVSLRITDEESRFPLNRLLARPDNEKALADALLSFTRKAGIANPEEAVDGLLDWCDPDLIRRPSGAEFGDYGKERVKDAPLDSLFELLRLPSWTARPGLPEPRRRPAPKLEDLRGLEPTGEFQTPALGRGPKIPETETMGGSTTSEWADWLTLHSSGKINVNTAPAPLLMSLDPDITDVAVQEIVQRRTDKAFTASDQLREIPGIDADLLFRLDAVLGYRSNTFEIRAVVDEPPGAITLRAIVRRGGGPMRVLWWEVQ